MAAEKIRGTGSLNLFPVILAAGNAAAMIAAYQWALAGFEYGHARVTEGYSHWMELFLMPDNTPLLLTLGLWISVAVAMLAYRLWKPVPLRLRVLYALTMATCTPLALAATHLILH